MRIFNTVAKYIIAPMALLTVLGGCAMYATTPAYYDSGYYNSGYYDSGSAQVYVAPPPIYVAPPVYNPWYVGPPVFLNFGYRSWGGGRDRGYRGSHYHGHRSAPPGRSHRNRR